MKNKLLKGVKLTFGIALVVIALLAAYLLTPVFGNKVLIVRSGSMAPTLPVGSLVAIRPKELIISPLPAVPLYSPGDVISFKDTHNPKVVTTHRVVSYKIEGNQILYQTKGDANQTVDQTFVTEKNVLGSTFLTLPYLGILFSFTKTKIGFLIMVLIPALMVILLESWNIFKEIRKKRPLRYGYLKNFSVNRYPTMTSLIPLLAVGLVFAQTAAYFSDSDISTNNVFAAAQIFPGAPGSVVINEIMWTGSQGNSADEWVELRNMTGSTIDLSNWVVDNLGSGAGSNVVITSGKSIQPNGYFIISNDTEPNSVISITPDQVINTSLNNTGEQLVLRSSAGGTIIDTANGTSDWYAGLNPPGQTPKSSMERNNPPLDGTIGTNWHTATTQVNIDTGKDEKATPGVAND